MCLVHAVKNVELKQADRNINLYVAQKDTTKQTHIYKKIHQIKKQ